MCSHATFFLRQFLNTSNEEDVRGTFGVNFPRLQDIKHKFDPDHLFRHTLWPSKDALAHGSPSSGIQIDGFDTRRTLLEEDEDIGMDGIRAEQEHNA